MRISVALIVTVIITAIIMSGCSTVKQANRQHKKTKSGRDIIVSQFEPTPDLKCSLVATKECHIGPIEANFESQGALGVCIRKLSPFADEFKADYIYFNSVGSSGIGGFSMSHGKRLARYYRCNAINNADVTKK